MSGVWWGMVMRFWDVVSRTPQMAPVVTMAVSGMAWLAMVVGKRWHQGRVARARRESPVLREVQEAMRDAQEQRIAALEGAVTAQQETITALAGRVHELNEQKDECKGIVADLSAQIAGLREQKDTCAERLEELRRDNEQLRRRIDEVEAQACQARGVGQRHGRRDATDADVLPGAADAA